MLSTIRIPPGRSFSSIAVRDAGYPFFSMSLTIAGSSIGAILGSVSNIDVFLLDSLGVGGLHLTCIGERDDRAGRPPAGNAGPVDPEIGLTRSAARLWRAPSHRADLAR